MMRRPFTISCVLLIALSLASAQGRRRPPIPPADLPPLLQRAIDAAKTARYSGERTVEFRVGADRKVFRELILRDGQRARIEFPGDSEYRGQVIVERDGERQHYFPDANEIRILPARGDEPMRRLMFVLSRGRDRGFKVQVQGGGNVAGLGTELATVVDPHGNPMQKLWIHPNSGVVLRREAYDPTGSKIGGFEFTRINLRPRFDRGDFTIVRRGATVVTQADMVRRNAVALGLTPVLIPESRGYKLLGVRVMDRGPQKILMQSYASSNGRLTLFQVKAPLSPDKLRRMGGRGEVATHTWVVGDESFALVGDVSADELRTLARDIGSP